jgi:hypothetical protein
VKTKLLEPNEIVLDVAEVFSWLTTKTVSLAGSADLRNSKGQKGNLEINPKVKFNHSDIAINGSEIIIVTEI